MKKLWKYIRDVTAAVLVWIWIIITFVPVFIVFVLTVMEVFWQFMINYIRKN